MSRLLIALLILTAAVAGLAMTARAQQEPSSAETAVPSEVAAPEPPMSAPSPTPCPPDRILVKVKPAVDPVVVIGRYGGTIAQTISGIDVQIVDVPAGTGQQAIDSLNADPDVQYAEPDRVVRIAGEGGGC